MAFIDKFLDRVRGSTLLADMSGRLPQIPPPKVANKPVAYPTFIKSTENSTNSIPRLDRQLASIGDLSRFTRTQGTYDTIRQLAHASPDLSATLFAYLRTAITRGYTATAHNLDGTLNPEATALLQQLLVRFDILNDYSNGFSGVNSMRTNSESLGKELILYGACSAELVLDKARIPKMIQPLSVTTITFNQDGDGVSPIQKVGGDDIDLDIPTFFYVSLDLELMEAYPSSPLESAIKPTLFSEMFIADLQRVCRQAIHPKVRVILDEESFRKNMPPDIMNDQEKIADYLQNIIQSVQDELQDQQPEDAFVTWDSVQINMENNGNISLSREYQTLADMTNAKMATGAKVMPSVLGHGQNSNIASTETLLFMQFVEGAVQFKLNDLYSRMLTLALRLFGLVVYANFKYNSVNLRPEAEMEPFKQMEQSRVLELLSLGFITDEEASIRLTGHMPPVGFKPLSGTMFKSANASTENPYMGATNNGSTLNQNLSADVPAGVKGQNKKANPVKQGTQ